MRAVQKDRQTWTYADYKIWPNNERWELIDGLGYNATPTPSRKHQQLSGRLFAQLFNHLQGKQLEVYSAPFEVRLPAFEGQADDEIMTVVQPDIAVCDPRMLDDAGCKNAPLLIVEISTTETSAHNLKEKLNLYERAGVNEYWIANLTYSTVMVSRLTAEGIYGRPEMYGSDDDKVAVPLLGDLVVNLADVFA